MSVSGNIINTPISLSDLSRTIGSSSSDLGTLCTHSNVNMWAKYKPFRYAALGFEQDNSGSTSKDRDNALKSANYGIGLKDDTKKSTGYLTITEAISYGYVYLRPEGGSSSPYRIADFIHYKHNAQAPVGVVADFTVNTFFLLSDYILKNVPLNAASSGSYELSISDISMLSDWYVGMAYLADSGSLYKYYYITAETSIGDGGSTLKLPVSVLKSVGTKNVSFFASRVPTTEFKGETAVAGYGFLPLPFKSIIDATVKMTVNTECPLKCTMVNISAETKSSVSTMLPISNYIDTISQTSGGMEDYLSVGSSGTVYIAVKAENTTSDDVSFNPAYLVASISPNMVNSENNINPYYSSRMDVFYAPDRTTSLTQVCYSSNTTGIKTIQISANGTAYFVFGVQYLLTGMSGTIQSGTQKKVKVELYFSPKQGIRNEFKCAETIRFKY